jgi:hypothetical protein
MTTEQKERDLQEIGKNAYESIAEMVAALVCDYERLDDLRQERADLVATAEEDTHSDDPQHTGEQWDKVIGEWDAESGEELAELIAAAGECESREDAEQRIQEDPLSIEVASDWTVLGEPLQAEKFNILLCTGGPAVRIVGELSDGEPSRAWLEVQDWFTPWIEYRGTISKTDPNAYDVPSQDVLLTYARCFYFGD